MSFLRNIINSGRRAAVAFVRRQDGGPASEFALTAPIFVVMIFATAQAAIIYFANSYLATAAEEGARLVLTNQATTMTSSQFRTAICNNIAMLFNCSSLMVNLAPATSNSSIVTSAPTFNTNGTLNLSYTQPSPGQIAVLQVMYEWPVIGLPLGWNFANLGNGSYFMMSTQVFLVEAQ